MRVIKKTGTSALAQRDLTMHGTSSERQAMILAGWLRRAAEKPGVLPSKHPRGR